MRRLPPLGALRAFEAAARHLNFTHAANELCVTQAAISHQVRLLEEWLGIRLFERRGHSLKLTTEGRDYVHELGHALDLVSDATARVGRRMDGPLRITALPSFASRWLVPSLGRFQRLHPKIDLKVTSSSVLWNGASEEFDVGIRSGLGRWVGLTSDLIAREELSPVYSPKLPLNGIAVRQPKDLLKMPLLHDTPRAAWRTWFVHSGVHGVDVNTGIAFDDSSLVLQAAVDGHGVALGRLTLAAEDLAMGRLIRPFKVAIPNDYSYWLVYTHAISTRPDFMAFRSWLLAEAKSRVADGRQNAGKAQPSTFEDLGLDRE